MGANVEWFYDIVDTYCYCCNFYKGDSTDNIEVISVFCLEIKEILKNLLTIGVWGHKIMLY